MMKRNRRRLSMVLALVLLLGMMPVSALAEETLTLSGDKFDGNTRTLTLNKGENGFLQLSKVLGDGIGVVVADEKVATVTHSSAGDSITVHAEAGGTTKVTVSGAAGENAEFTVTVNSPVTELRIDPRSSQTLSEKSSFTFTVSCGPDDATNKNEIVWHSSDPAVADFVVEEGNDSTVGKVEGKSAGKTEIFAKVGNVTSEKVTVYVSGVTLEEGTSEENPLKILVGKSASLDYGIYGEAEDYLPEWTSNNPVALGVANGTIYAYNPSKEDNPVAITLKAGPYTKTCWVQVDEDMASSISVPLAAGETLDFADILLELEKRAREQISETAKLKYISAISANPKQGVVYYGYSAPESPGLGVGNIDNFYRVPDPTQMGIKDLSFVPDKSFGGDAVITYVGYDTNDVPFSGRIIVTVENSGDVTYNTESDKPVFFSAEDFNTACRIKTGQALRYVTFRLPAKAQGVLYQSYNTAGQYMAPVTGTAKYYVVGSTLHLDDVVFVPAADFTGKVEIDYTAVDSSGNSYPGKIAITVNPSSSSSIDAWVEGAVRYTTTGEVVNFAGADFEQACLEANGEKLRHVSFTLPTAAEGKLYANYVSKAKPGTAVSENSSYTVKNLSTVSFVPAEGFAGTVTIPFTGLDVEGEVFSGTVVIRVLNYEVQVDYTTASLPVTFDPEDFRFSCVSALPKQLASVEFTDLPSAYAGRLLLDYKGFGEGTAVTRGTRYYYSGTPALGKITFVPAADYQGTIELPYTAYDSAGNSVDGVALIHVSRSYAKLEFSDLAGYTGAIPAIEFLKENGVIGGYSDGTFRPTAATSRAAYAAMVCRLFGFKAEVTGNPYPDVSRNSWCAETAAAARKYGVIYGDKNGRFNPTASVTKQQAVVMLQRAMEASGRKIPAASTAILRNYRDGASVSDYAKAAMSNMIALGVVEADYYGYLKPDAPITRVEMATILYRLLVL